MRVYPDACVLIYLIEEHPELHPRIDAAVRAVPNLAFTLSELLRLECRVRPMKQGNRELLEKFDRFFANPTHVYIPASRPVFNLATEFRAHHGLRTPDALHLATAIHAECNEFWTNDRRLEKAAADHINIVTYG